MKALSKQEILQKIANHEVSAEEGIKIYREMLVSNQAKSCIEKEQKKKDTKQDGIAIIGISGKFADADNVEEYWKELVTNKSGIHEIPLDRKELIACGADERAYIQNGGFLDNIDQFDPLFFHISPKEAEYMDPRQKLFLEESWKAIADAGYAAKSMNGKKCGVYVGIQQGEYLERFEGEVGESIPTGNSLSVIPARVSYLLNLKGPAIALDTACSSSLAAICLACESIMNGTNDMALAGGIQLMLEPDIYLSLGKLGMLSKGGCKPFDENADGICLGEGVGVILLKKYSEAILDGDHIYGVIKGFGMNQDGKTNGITAPNGLSQAELIREVYQKFNINPKDISYIETHGTGTKLGDPIEVQALTDVYHSYNLPKESCVLSSVKGNIGHTLSASGVASVIKVLLSLKYETIPAILNCKKENTLIAFDKTPFVLAKENKEWKKKENQLRMAAISSFGMSGTNCHIVIEESKREEREEEYTQDSYLFILSAKSQDALSKMKQDMAVYLENQGRQYSLKDICMTAFYGRDVYDFRFACIINSKEQLLQALQTEEQIEYVIPSKELFRMKEQFMDGKDNRDILPKEISYSKLSLPTYPFERVRCYRDRVKKNYHDLRYVERNTSSMNGVSYERDIQQDDEQFSNKSYYQTNVISEGALLALGYEGGCDASKRLIKEMWDIQFARPLVMKSVDKETYQVKYSGSNEQLKFAFSEANGTVLVKGRLKAETDITIENESVVLEQEVRNCTVKRNSEIFYKILEQQGLTCFKTNQWIYMMYHSLQKNIAYLKSMYIENRASQVEVLLEVASQIINFIKIQEGTTIASLSEVKQVVWSNHSGILSWVEVKENAECYEAFGYDRDGKVLMKAIGIQMTSFAMNHIESVMEEESYCLMEPKWVEKNIEAYQEKIKGRYGIIVQEEIPDDLQKRIEDTLEQAEWIRQEHLDTYEFQGEDSFTGIIDFSDMTEACETSHTKSYEKIVFLQKAVKRHIAKPFSILHFTKKTVSPDGVQHSLNGVDVAGIIRILGEEYTNIVSKTIDVDVDIKDIMGIVCAELMDKKEDREILYVSKKRYVLNYACLKYESKWKERTANNRICISPEKAYIVAGGTRGIGAEVARLLARRGARKLIIIGNSPYPAREEWEKELENPNTERSIKDKIRRVLELEEFGVQVQIYTGKLTDYVRLEHFIHDMEQKLGAIDGVVYCAGSNLNRSPAFMNKSIEDIKTVFEPKVEAVETLHQVLKEKSLSFFLAFSSISAALPKLSVGLSDYGSANYYLEHFMRYQYTKGFKSYKTLIWPSWLEVGMLVDMDFKLGSAYSDIGITAHGLADGLFMLENASHITGHPSMIPAIVNQKFQRNAPLTRKDCKGKDCRSQDMDSTDYVQSQEDVGKLRFIMDTIKKFLTEELYIEEERLADTVNFADIGVDSIILVEVIKKLEKVLHTEVDASLFLEYSTVKELGTYLWKKMDDAVVKSEENCTTVNKMSSLIWATETQFFEETAFNSGSNEEEQTTEKPMDVSSEERFKKSIDKNAVSLDRRVAIIGMSCRFPGANSHEEFWHNLVNGISSIREVPKDRWNIDTLYSAEYQDGKSTGKWGGYLDNIKDFDAEYFEFKDHVEQISPLMRLFLECTANVIRDAGYQKDEISGKNIGIYVGTHSGSYPSWVTDFNKDTIIGIGQNFIAAYASHFFNLKGPSSTVDSACSSSLLSIHHACQSLWLGETEMAIAGGIDLLLDERQHMVFSASKALSPDGKCHTFDEHANGIVPGEGVGAVLLKPYTKAVADGDPIYAVIESSAANNDGRTMGVTTPSMTGQMNVIRAALERGNINPRTIGYVETHGTGTMIGDPIELKSLMNVYRDYTQDNQFCSVGSVKTNIGHCLSAAGIASFIKTILCIYHKTLVPTLNCETPNKRFHFESSPFYLVKEAKKWEQNEKRRAGISAFGFGGTNVHIIVGEFQEEKENTYVKKRSSLGEQEFNRKYAWIKEKEQEVEESIDMSAFLDFTEE